MRVRQDAGLNTAVSSIAQSRRKLCRGAVVSTFRPQFVLASKRAKLTSVFPVSVGGATNSDDSKRPVKPSAGKLEPPRQKFIDPVDGVIGDASEAVS